MNIEIKIPEDVVRDQSNNINKLLSPFCEGFSYLADKIRLARYDVCEKTLKKSKNIIEEYQIPAQELENRFLIPFLEKCSYENLESEMTDRWASLFANAVDDKGAAHPTYIDILSQITVDEALLLRGIWLSLKEDNINKLELFSQLNPSSNTLDHGRTTDFLSSKPKNSFFIFGASYKEKFPEYGARNARNIKSLQILEKHNLLKSEVRHDSDFDGKQYVSIYAILTPLGFEFTEACEKYCKDGSSK